MAICVVYIREAHPKDGWQVAANVREGVIFTQPKTFDERSHIAKTFCTKLKLSIPCLIDGLDDKVGRQYDAWPDRLYVIGLDGKIVYKSGPGPRGFKPAEAEEALREYLKTHRDEPTGSQ